jgi:hypothetical protein
MAKKGQTTKVVAVVKCACSTCGQVSNAKVDTFHFSCTGFSVRMPRGITNPARKGVWVAVVA